jgi:malate dehydrogenase (oxaloacetate-decarboxylating)(NADP+)
MDTKIFKEALKYHGFTRPGKIEIIPSKPFDSSNDLSLAYFPGVAEPCRKISENTDEVYKYTIKGNLVGIITNGTNIHGLGNLGALAAKPAMEGKAMLLKKFADINAFDIELNTSDIDVFVRTVITMSPTFGAINLEGIKAPDCFEIEQRLIDALDIPVMHNNQHGTAIASAAALLNACEIAGKKLGAIKLVLNGAGAEALACAEMYLTLGVKKDNIIVLDSKGVLSTSRIDLDKYKQNFAINSNLKTLEQAMEGADIYIGFSTNFNLAPKLILSMAENPIVFALSNPNPEINYNEAINTKPGIIYANGFGDCPNHISNLLGTPYIFRAALDVRATKINAAMKKAAVIALASLAKESIDQLDSDEEFNFGRNYFIPNLLDSRLLTTIAPAIAKAAMDSGVAKYPIEDFDNYIKYLEKHIIK